MKEGAETKVSASTTAGVVKGIAMPCRVEEGAEEAAPPNASRRPTPATAGGMTRAAG